MLTLIHFGDLHAWRLALEWRDPYLKRGLGFFNWWLRRGKRFPPALAQRMLRHLEQQEADLLVFSGDFSAMAQGDEFARARQWLEPLRRKWGARFFAIPGNHDRYTPRSARSAYESHFADEEMAAGQGVKRMVVDGGLSLVGFDASIPRPLSCRGYFPRALHERLESVLLEEERAGRRSILVGHYPYAVPPLYHHKWSRRLVGASSLAGLIARYRPLLYLHGHEHRRRWALRPPQTPETLCLNSGSIGLWEEDPLKRAGFLTVELNEARQPIAVRATVALFADWDKTETFYLPV